VNPVQASEYRFRAYGHPHRRYLANNTGGGESTIGNLQSSQVKKEGRFGLFIFFPSLHHRSNRLENSSIALFVPLKSIAPPPKKKNSYAVRTLEGPFPPIAPQKLRL